MRGRWPMPEGPASLARAPPSGKGPTRKARPPIPWATPGSVLAGHTADREHVADVLLLQRLFEATEGRSLAANIALVLNNAALAAAIAAAVAAS